jgi:hypothetical protein
MWEDHLVKNLLDIERNFYWVKENLSSTAINYVTSFRKKNERSSLGSLKESPMKNERKEKHPKALSGKSERQKVIETG